MEEEDELQRAIEASKEQARLDAMIEEELLAEAIAQSQTSSAALAEVRASNKRDSYLLSSPTTGNFARKRRGSVSADRDAVGQDKRRPNPEDPAPSQTSLQEATELQPIRNAFSVLQSSTSKKTARSSGLGDTVLQPVPMPAITAVSFSSEPGRCISKYSSSLDLVFWKSWLREPARNSLRDWMLCELSWHRVIYTRPNGGITIHTPRFTTTFGRDDLPGNSDGSYSKTPKAIPECLMAIKEEIERITQASYNALIVNYYQDGNDSISYHSDDETFLGPNPSIASLTLGSTRDFLMRRKAPSSVSMANKNQFYTKSIGPAATRPTEKFMLEDGDLLLMRGRTQAEWEHAVPKRKNAPGGRINITFRRVVNRKGTENFLRYNRGDGPTWRFQNGRMEEAPENPGI